MGVTVGSPGARVVGASVTVEEMLAPVTVPWSVMWVTVGDRGLSTWTLKVMVAVPPPPATALAVEHHAELHSNEADFSRFQGCGG